MSCCALAASVHSSGRLQLRRTSFRFTLACAILFRSRMQAALKAGWLQAAVCDHAEVNDVTPLPQPPSWRLAAS